MLSDKKMPTGNFPTCTRIINQNQIFHFTRCKTPKRVTSLRGPFPRHCARAAQLLSKKCCSGREPWAALCLIWPARDLSLRPPAPETNALPREQLVLSQIIVRYLAFSSTWEPTIKLQSTFALYRSLIILQISFRQLNVLQKYLRLFARRCNMCIELHLLVFAYEH